MIKTVWIDLDNTPHVPLFRPIISELQKKGIRVIVTARNYAQTIELLQLWGIPHTAIGTHGGKSKIKKILNLLNRSMQLIQFIKKEKVDLALSHGSRTQLVAAKVLKIPSILMLDYEYTESKIFNYLASVLLMPEFIPEKVLLEQGFIQKKLRRYPYYKEELYLPLFKPEPDFRKQLGVCEEKIFVVIRPSATLGNYHNELSEKILLRVLERISTIENIEVLVVARTRDDRQLVERVYPNRFKFLEKSVDGLQLIWAADVVISGGGTMNRESALLGIPTYSIFTGRKPYLDIHLSSLNRLHFVDTLDKVDEIVFTRRSEIQLADQIKNDVAEKTVDIILKLFKE